MTTKSTVANMLIAERVREIQGLREESEEAAEDPRVEEDEASSEPEEDPESEDEQDGDSDDLPPIFEERSERWYRPNTQKGHKFAVRMPEGVSTKYYQTVEGAANRLRKEYGDE